MTCSEGACYVDAISPATVPCGEVDLAEVVKVSAQSPEPADIEYAAEWVRGGQVISVPTETFYALSTDPFNLYAVEEIFRIKGRPGHKPLLLLVASIEQAEELSSGNLPDRFYALARRFWPGPLTLVIGASRRVPLKITGNTGKVAVRLPDAQVPVSLIRRMDMPLTGTSANLAGTKECGSAREVQHCLGGRLPLILDGGESKIQVPSTIVEVNREGWRLIREGAIPSEQITEFLAAENA